MVVLSNSSKNLSIKWTDARDNSTESIIEEMWIKCIQGLLLVACLYRAQRIHNNNKTTGVHNEETKMIDKITVSRVPDNNKWKEKLFRDIAMAQAQTRMGWSSPPMNFYSHYHWFMTYYSVLLHCKEPGHKRVDHGLVHVATDLKGFREIIYPCCWVSPLYHDILQTALLACVTAICIV